MPPFPPPQIIALSSWKLPCLLIAFGLWLPIAQAQDPASFRVLLLQGKYEEAREGFETLLANPKHRQAALLGLSQILEETGQTSKALELLRKEAKPAPALLGKLAQLEYSLGNWDKALKHCEEGFLSEPDQLLCRWIRGRIWFDSGEIEKGVSEFRWFVRSYSERLDTPKAYTKAEELCLIAQASYENARWSGLGDELPTILKDLLGDAIKADPNYWPAEALAGQILLEKHNRPEALAAFDKVLSICAENPLALTGKGQAALDRLEYAEAEALANRALKSNPTCLQALQLKASIYLAQGDLPQARKELTKSRSQSGRQEYLLGMLGGIAWLEGKTAELQGLEAEAGAFDKKPAQFHFAMAEILAGGRRYQEAISRYQKAIELRSNLPEPHIGLAMLYLQMGNETEAKKLLSKGFAQDPFHVRASNSLKVLAHLEKYQTLETDHYLIRFDPKSDTALAACLAWLCEQTHVQLATRFGFTPRNKTLVEVFSSHEMFAGRTVALPDLHTIGACTGKVITLVSPQGKSVKPFNWARVIRHELTHIFNLEQSNFLTPHWLTEGLAVSQEGYPKPAFWNGELHSRLEANQLFNLDTIQLGFQRPRSPMDWQMAYCQSLHYVEFLQARHGPDAPTRLLTALGKGSGMQAALRQEFKIEQPALEAEFKQYLAKQLAGPKIRKAPRSVVELKKALEKTPGDADAQGELSWLVFPRDKVEARKLAEAAVALKPSQARALMTLSRLARLSGDPRREQAFLEEACKSEEDVEAFFLLGRLYYEAGDFPKALEHFQKVALLEPAESRAQEYLTRVFTQMGDKTRQFESLQKLCEQNPDDLEKRKRLLALAIQTDRKAEAFQAARWVLEIDPRDAISQKLLLEQLQGQGKIEEAKRLDEAFNKKGGG